MKKKHYIGIRSKIILYTILCVVAVGLISSSFLYQYMQEIISAKIKSVDALNAKTIAAQVNYNLERVETLSFYCSNSETVAAALQWKTLQSLPAKNAALEAQAAMNSYLRTSPIDSYINKMLIFNDSGVIVNAFSTYTGRILDYPNLIRSTQFTRWMAGDAQPFDQIYASIDASEKDCFALLSKVYGAGGYTPVGYVYLEVNPAVITDVLAPYSYLNQSFIQTAANDRLTSSQSLALLSALPQDIQQDAPFRYDESLYTIQPYPLRQDTLTLFSCINQTELKASNRDVLFSLFTVILMIILIAASVLVLLTHYITTPINRIVKKINKIALNDFTFDPSLEKPHSEMGEIGARLNELGLGFQQLLDETIALHDERAEIEMALLQSQVNPHFLYNTLNSVLWMSIIQKNVGIEKTVRSLVNLLKNISKGVSAKISLAEELSLLDDYINIQSIRYMGSFDYVCTIPAQLRNCQIIKFTLQPLVENAIFHGVVPKGTFGTITADAYEEGKFLVITITDDGVGMTPEETTALLRSTERIDRSSMCGIGLSNVNSRLKLTYGREAGLSVESVKGSYTKVSVRILREQEGGETDVPYITGG